MISKVKCIIVDDEPFARKGLQGYIEKTGFLDLVAVCEDAIQLNVIIKEQKVDLVFLDIEMPYMTGIDFLKAANNPPKVIFTTAYEQYALQSYELDVLDYLLKPVSFERFLKAANKAYDYFKSKETGAADFMFIKAGNKLEKIYFDQVYFFEALENYVSVYLNDKKIITRSTLKALQQQLPPALFIQSHKSYLVNINAVQSIEDNMLNVHKYQVPISKYLKDEVIKKIVDNRMLNK
jgi:DNA-binding LytR/AlgR family response regulator